jgi:hypothetical protein
MLNDTCILLNTDYTPLGLISLKKALKLWSKGKIEIIKTSNQIINNFENTICILAPKIIRLLKMVRSLWKTKVPFSKRALAIRDNYQCQYCGKIIKNNNTVDHITPRSIGGKTTWENCVLSCLNCNNKKDNKKCSDVKMYPLNQPYTPTINQFILLSIKNSGLDKMLQEIGIL